MNEQLPDLELMIASGANLKQAWSDSTMIMALRRIAQLEDELETYRERHRDAKSNFAALQRLRKENAQLEAGLADVDRILQIEMKENAELKRLIKDEFDFGEGEIRHYLKHALLTREEQDV